MTAMANRPGDDDNRDDGDSEPLSAMDAFRERLRERFPDIRPYGEEDWDWTWADEGMEFLNAQDYAMAELRFQELIAAQPGHCDGYEGLALVYARTGRKDEALVLMDEAIRIAQLHAREGLLENEVVGELVGERDAIRAGEYDPQDD